MIGPCISQGSYELTEDLRSAVGDERFFVPGRDAAHWQFDLPGYCSARLSGCGLVEVLGMDTLREE